MVHSKAIYLLSNYFDQSPLLNHFQQSFAKNFEAKKPLKDIPEESVDFSQKDNFISGLNSLLSPRSLQSDTDLENCKDDNPDHPSSEQTIDKFYSHSFLKKTQKNEQQQKNVSNMKKHQLPKKIQEPIALDIDKLA